LIGNELKILAIDDDEEILYALRAVFQFQGWTGITATDVPTGVKLFQLKKPDLVLIDYHLPQVSGIRGVELIRELDPDVPIIVFTIDESQEVAGQFMAAGASDFDLKPLKVTEIISKDIYENVIKTLRIPAEVQALNGYGETNHAIKWDENGKVWWYTPDGRTDISTYFIEDNLIPVEGGGTITAVNAEGLAAPTTIVCQKRGV
jgi:CheY-like chemotaxis protein